MANGIDFGLRFPFITTVLASKFGNLDLRPLSVVLNGIQAAVLGRGTQNPKKFETAYKMQSYFNLTNLAINFWSFGYLVNELGKKYSLFNMNLTWTDLGNIFSSRNWKYEHPEWTAESQYRFGGYGYLAMIGGVTAAIIAVKILNKIHTSSQQQLKIEDYSEDPDKRVILEKEVKISWNRPFGQKFGQWVYVSQLCLNIALATLSSSRIYFALNVALNGYALYRITQRKWLSVSRTKQWEIGLNNSYVTKVQGIYQCLLMSFSAQKNQKDLSCTVCLEEKPEAYFHGEHVFHGKCLIQFVIQKSDEFTDFQSFKREEWADQRGYRTIHYFGSMPKSKMPGCPNCREKPFYNELDIIVHETRSSSVAHIDWTEV